MPSLRGHHLVCLHFFNGEGYNEMFIDNLRAVLNSAKDGEVEVSRGADDICRKCPHLNHARCRYSEDADEGIAEIDERALDLLHLSQGTKVKWDEVKGKLSRIFQIWYNTYCLTCAWKRACEKDSRFRQLKESL